MTRTPCAAFAPRARRLSVLVAVLMTVLVAVQLSGCTTSKPEPTPLANYKPAIAGRLVWQAKLEGIDFPLQLVARPDAFVAADKDGAVLALEPGSGQVLWRARTGSALSAGVGFDGRFASVVTRNNELVVFESGVERWRKRLPAGVLTAPLVAGERVFVLRTDRAVMAFDVLDGRPLWTFQRPGEPLTLGQAGIVAPFGNMLLVGQGSRLVGLDPLRGTLRWESAVATPRGTNEVERLTDLIGPALRIADLVCARAFQAAVGCVDARRGVLAWSRPSAGATALGGDAELLLGTDATGRLTAWRTPTGEVAWSQDLLRHREPSAPLLAGSVAVVGDLEGQVHFLSRQDGTTQLRLPTDGTPVIGMPVLSGTTLLVATRAGGLFAFRPQ